MSLADELGKIADALTERITEAQADALAELSQTLANLADDAEIVEVRCIRCDRPFRSLAEVKYCTKECELGGVPMPYQTREEQARLI